MLPVVAGGRLAEAELGDLSADRQQVALALGQELEAGRGGLQSLGLTLLCPPQHGSASPLDSDHCFQQHREKVGVKMLTYLQLHELWFNVGVSRLLPPLPPGRHRQQQTGQYLGWRHEAAAGGAELPRPAYLQPPALRLARSCSRL